MTTAEARGEQNAERGLSVGDVTPLDHLECGRERHRLDSQEFIGFMSGLATLEAIDRQLP